LQEKVRVSMVGWSDGSWYITKAFVDNNESITNEELDEESQAEQF
jgi:hypothetical protein